MGQNVGLPGEAALFAASYTGRQTGREDGTYSRAGQTRGWTAHPSGSSPVASRRHIADTAPAAIKALPHSAVPHVVVKLPAPSQSVFAVHPRACPSRLPVPSPRPDCLPVPSTCPDCLDLAGELFADGLRSISRRCLDCLILRVSNLQSVSEVHP